MRLVLLLLATVEVWGAYPNGYAFRRKLTIDQTKLTATVTDFPVLVSGTYSYLATVANGGRVTDAEGDDVVFTDSNGTTALKHEVEVYTAATGVVQYWVKVPSVSSSVATVIYVYYGNPGVTTDQSDKNNVWDSSFKGVWHLPDGTTLTANDSTTSAVNGTVTSATATAGKVDGAMSSSGSTQYVDMGTNKTALQPTAAITFQAWINPNSTTQNAYTFVLGQDYVIPRASPYVSYQIGMNHGSATGTFFAAISTVGVNSSIFSSITYAASTWYHVVCTYDGSNFRIYVDSVLKSTTVVVGSISYNSTGRWRIAANGESVEGANAKVDEVRVSSIARAAGWITAEYNNQNSPSTFYSVGAEEVSGRRRQPIVFN